MAQKNSIESLKCAKKHSNIKNFNITPKIYPPNPALPFAKIEMRMLFTTKLTVRAVTEIHIQTQFQ
jgi:hypothetical protein